MGFNFNFLKDLDSETKGIKKGFGFLKRGGENTADFGKAVVDRAGGGLVRSGIRLGATIAEPLPGQQRKAANKFIKDYAEVNTPENTSGIGNYDPKSVGGKTGRATGTAIKVGADLYGINKASNVVKGAAKGLGVASKAKLFVAGSLGSSLGSTAETVGQGKDVNVAKDLATGLAFDTATAGIGKLAKTDAAQKLIGKLAKTSKVDEVKNLLKGKVHPNVIEGVSGAIAKTNDHNVVKNILSKEAANVPEISVRKPSESPSLHLAVKDGRIPDTYDMTPINALKFGGRDTAGVGADRKIVEKKMEDIRNFKQVDPIIVDKNGFVQDGQNSYMAYRNLGIKHVPTVTQIEKPVAKELKGAARQASLSKPAEQGGYIDPVAIYQDIKKGISKLRKPKSELPATTEAQNLVPSSSASSVSQDPFKEINDAISGKPAAPGQAPVKGIASASKEQAALLSKERGQRFENVSKTTDAGSGGYFKEKSALKGGYGKVDYHPMIEDIGPDRAEELFTGARAKIKATPDDVYRELGLHPEGARLNTQTAVRKVLGLEPGVPTKSELKLLKVFSPKLATDIESKIPKGRKILDAASTIFGSARSAKSTLDLSMGGRQGLFVAGRHPIQWAKANAESVKYAKSGKYYKQEMRAIHDDEWGQLIDKYNPSVLTGGAGHEESFASSDLLTGKVAKDKLKIGNLVAGSERAYTGGLTKLRKDILTKSLRAYGATADQAEQKLGEKGMAGLIEAVSTLTGRGGKTGGFVSKHATTLQEALFSPRLWASRLQPLNPAFWKRIGPAGRKEAIQSLGAFAAVAGTVLTAAVAGGAEVETDPRSSDFLKIKVGDTRYDILGGFQQNLVFGARQISGSTKSSQTGRVTKYGEGFGAPTRLTTAFDLVRNKANPVLGAGANLLEGKDKAGNSINPLTEIGQLFVPISLQSSFNARNNPKDVLKQLPDLVGVGSQTYGLKDLNISPTQKKYIDKLSDPKQKEASTRFFQTLKTAPNRDKVTADIKDAFRAKDTAKAKKLAADYNTQLDKALDKWREQYSPYRKDKELSKAYQSAKITPESLRTYLLNVRKGE